MHKLQRTVMLSVLVVSVYTLFYNKLVENRIWQGSYNRTQNR